MTGKQLKNSILQWAIQGKLVPQDPNDEPASVLLEKIREEKARLIKEGKIKKDKKESIIYRGEDNSYYEKFADGKVVCIDDEIPFAIPESWQWVRLRSITSLLGDGIHGTPEYDNNGMYFFINGNNLKEKAIIIKPDTKKVNEKEYSKYKKELNETTVLVSINGTLGNVAFYNDEPVMLGKSACYFNLIYKQLKDYIYLVLNSPYFLEYALSAATGTTIKNVSLQAMNNLLIPFPSIIEQNRITNKIDFLTSTLLKYSKQEFQLNRLNSSIRIILKKSVLQEAIQGRLVPQDPNDEPASVLLEKIRAEKTRLIKEGKLKKKDLVETVIFRDDNKYFEKKGKEVVCIDDEIPFEIPESWQWKRLGNICELIGGYAFPSESIKEGNGIRVIRISDISECGFVNTRIVRYNGDETLSAYNIKLGDILMAMTGGTVGKSLFVTFLPEPMLLNQRVVIIRNTFMDRNYMNYVITAPHIKSVINEKKNSTNDNISMKDIYNFLIPLPPYEEQKRIVNRIDEVIAHLT